jgi:glycerol-3-phosphate dehydrogenase
VTYDAIVIGGGITGAGAARDFALRGWKTLLLERGRFGRATTAGSSHLIHGGLRYLLYDRLTTHETCWDSGRIVRLARPLLTRLPILWPVYGDHRRGIETVETLLESYDAFQPLKEGRRHLRLSPAETLRLAPGLKPVDLRGGLLFDEYWVEAADLVAANVSDARRAGADALEDAGVEAIARDNGRVTGVRVLGGKTFQAPVIVNAAGPWAARVAALAGAAVALRLQKGTHLVYRGAVPALAGPRPVGLLLEAVDRERYVFVLPGPDRTLVGPTDLPVGDDPDALTPTPEETAYLLASCRRYFPVFPDRWDALTVAARPIVGQRGPEKRLSRGFKVIDHAAAGADGFLSVIGGKMSDFRLMAEATAAAVHRRVGRGAFRSVSASRDLAGRPVAADERGRPPSAALKRILDLSPRGRELHALAHLGVAFARHEAVRRLRPVPTATLEDVLRHYQ